MARATKKGWLHVIYMSIYFRRIYISMEQVTGSAQVLAEIANSLQQTVSEFTIESDLLCPYFATCPIFERSSPGMSKYISQYCKGEFEECERKKRKDAGKLVPPTLLPDGNIPF